MQIVMCDLEMCVQKCTVKMGPDESTTTPFMHK